MKRPSLGAVLLGAVPFVACCFTVSLWDRVYPTIGGLPFNFFWLISWLLLTPLCMWGAYRLEKSRTPDGSGSARPPLQAGQGGVRPPLQDGSSKQGGAH